VKGEEISPVAEPSAFVSPGREGFHMVSFHKENRLEIEEMGGIK